MSNPNKARKNRRAVSKASSPAPAAPLTISRPELLVDGSDSEFRRLVHGLFGFFARHEAVRSGHARRIGLVGIEYTVLISIRHLVADEGEASVNRVAEHLYLSGAFITTITNKLLRRGLIHKEQDSVDRRRVRLDVSDKGNELLAELAPIQRQVNDVQFEPLSAAEFHQLISIIERLIESSERAVRLQSYIGHMPAPEALSAVSKLTPVLTDLHGRQRRTSGPRTRRKG